jgi:hypothetical protein
MMLEVLYTFIGQASVLTIINYSRNTFIVVATAFNGEKIGEF